MKGTNNNRITQRIRELELNTKPNTLAQVALTTFLDFTPVDKGNARNRTKLKGDSIHADYAYAKRLDEGYSKQKGGVGMTRPTLEAIRKYLAEQA